MAATLASNASGPPALGNVSPQTAQLDGNVSNSPSFPAPKTDKPRPHVCGTCSRSFARLEHLKRHERSHTKEKPFECPQCQRCFARRDLLLRHQQKLHQSTTPSSRPRHARRDSATCLPTLGAGRVRKNSSVGFIGGLSGAHSSMRPRANTIGHIDVASLGFLTTHAPLSTRPGGVVSHSHHASLDGSQPISFDYNSMSAPFGQHSGLQGLPKLDTQVGLGMGLGNNLRTAPVGNGVHHSFEVENLMSADSTINPAQLHFGSSFVNTPNLFPPVSANPTMEEDEGQDWLGGLDQNMIFPSNDRAVFDQSSPSTGSQSGFSDSVFDNPNSAIHQTNGWQNSPIVHSSMVSPASFGPDAVNMDFANAMYTIAPKDLHDPMVATDFSLADLNMSEPSSMPVVSPPLGVPGMPTQYFQKPTVFNSNSPSVSSPSPNGSARHSSVSSISSELISDTTRQSLLTSLSQPLNLGFSTRRVEPPPKLPGVTDMQRYIEAYIKCFHPHCPFLHISTLSVDEVSSPSGGLPASRRRDKLAADGGCLILSMAAIGALYESERSAARQLYDGAKKLIRLFLDTRRKQTCSEAVNSSNHGMKNGSTPKVPLWLVQARLLNLIYGHNCGEKLATNVSNVQCAGLVSLLSEAGLADSAEGDGLGQLAQITLDQSNGFADTSFNLSNWGNGPAVYGTSEHQTWLAWKASEEKKRTFYAVHMLSTGLLVACNQPPRILNSEIRLALPCDEDLWAAQSASEWSALGGSARASETSVSFAEGLSYLLNANQRSGTVSSTTLSSQYASSCLPHSGLPPSEFSTSTFGLHVLINALHVYIWETCQRHGFKRWNRHETEVIFSQIAPALDAWQASWNSNPNHDLEHDAKLTSGLLAMDSLPLLNLAYVRLIVSMNNSQVACWPRNWENIMDAIQVLPDPAVDSKPVANAGLAPSPKTAADFQVPLHDLPDASLDLNGISEESAAILAAAVVGSASNSPSGSPNPGAGPNNPLRRERMLRRASHYAAELLSLPEKVNTTLSEFMAPRGLPLQTIMSTFDCAQIFAEWMILFQERVGPSIQAVIDDDTVGLVKQLPESIVEPEDIRLLEKIGEIIATMDMKMTLDLGTEASSNRGIGLAGTAMTGYAAKLLLVTSWVFEKSSVWPISRFIAAVVEAYAEHLSGRADKSIPPLDFSAMEVA